MVREIASSIRKFTFTIREVTFSVKEVFSLTRYFTSLTRKVKYLVSFFRPFSPKTSSKTKKHQAQPLNPAIIVKTLFLTFVIKMMKNSP